MPVDPLDVAYIAIGARQALAGPLGAHKSTPGFEGELSYVQACIDQAGLLGCAWDEYAGAFPGVWCYDVAEPFGHAFGKHLQEGGSSTDAAGILGVLIEECMRAAAA
jgi:hypothetical protein